MTADAVHSLTDLISDIATLSTISYSLRSPTSKFPHGYGKVESLGALGVSSILLSGGIMIGLQAIFALATQFFPAIAEILAHIPLLNIFAEHGHSHGSVEDFGPNINAAWLAGGSIIIKEWLYRATLKVALEKRSGVLASNAYHHRVDSLTAVVALVTICASHFLTNAQWLDPVGGLVISGMIVQAGIGNTWAALLELADQGMDEEVRVNVENAVKEILRGSEAQEKRVQGIKSGQNYLVEVAVRAPETWTLRQMRETEGKVREHVAKKVKGVKRVTIKFTNQDGGEHAFGDEFMAFDQDAGAEHDHDHEHDHSHDHKTNGTANGGLTKRK